MNLMNKWMHERHAPLWLIYNAYSSRKDVWESRMPYVFGYLKFCVSSILSFLIRLLECYLIRTEGF